MHGIDFSEILVPYEKPKVLYELSHEGDTRTSIVQFNKEKDRHLRISKQCFAATDSTKLFRSFIYQSHCVHPAIYPIEKLSVSPSKSFDAFYKFPENGKLSDFIGFSFESVLSPDKQLTPTQKSIIGYGIAHAMKHIHRKNLLFAELTAKNIYLDDNFHPLLTSFYSIQKIEDPKMKPSKRLTKIHLSVDVYAYSIIYAALIEPVHFATPVENPRDFLKRLSEGERPIFDLATDLQKNMLELMWDRFPRDRITFEQIVSYFETGELLFPGTDISVFDKYKEDINEATNDIYMHRKMSIWAEISKFAESLASKTFLKGNQKDDQKSDKEKSDNNWKIPNKIVASSSSSSSSSSDDDDDSVNKEVKPIQREINLKIEQQDENESEPTQISIEPPQQPEPIQKVEPEQVEQEQEQIIPPHIKEEPEPQFELLQEPQPVQQMEPDAELEQQQEPIQIEEEEEVIEKPQNVEDEETEEEEQQIDQINEPPPRIESSSTSSSAGEEDPEEKESKEAHEDATTEAKKQTSSSSSSSDSEQEPEQEQPEPEPEQEQPEPDQQEQEQPEQEQEQPEPEPDQQEQEQPEPEQEQPEPEQEQPEPEQEQSEPEPDQQEQEQPEPEQEQPEPEPEPEQPEPEQEQPEPEPDQQEQEQPEPEQEQPLQEIEPEIEYKQEQKVEQEEHVQEPEVEEKAKIKKEGEEETRPARLRPKIARRVDDKGKIEECDSSGDECTNKVSEHPSSDEEPIAAAESSNSDVGEIIDEFRSGDSD